MTFRVFFTVFFLSGILVIIFSILLVTEGVAKLQMTTDTVQDSTGEMRSLMNEAKEVANNLEEVGQIGLSLRDEIVHELDPNNLCSDNPVFNQTDFGKALSKAAQDATALLNTLGDFVGDQMKELKTSIEYAQTTLDQADAAVASVEQNEWIGTSLLTGVQSHYVKALPFPD